MQSLDKYIKYSSVFALFTEDFSFHYIIDWKLFYVILISNLILFGLNHKIKVPKNIIYIVLFFVVHGVIMYTIYQNPIKSLIVQIIGISISSIFYYNLLKEFGTKKLFKLYLNFALFFAVLAIPMYYFGINSFTKFRLNGIMSEPAHYAAIMLPAVYYFLRNKNYVKLSVVVLTIILSKSSIGFIGLLLILILPLLKVKYFVRYAVVVLILISAFSYYLSTKWNEPINENESNSVVRRLKETNETLSASYNGKFKKETNLSTYAFLSNLFITKEIILHKPLGTGLGSYQYEYDKYYEELSPPKYLINLNQSKINRTDANSLLFRIFANFGIIGLIIILYFVLRSFNLFRNDKKIASQATFFYLIVKLIREGHYFPPEFYFFLLIFLKEFDEDTTYS